MMVRMEQHNFHFLRVKCREIFNVIDRIHIDIIDKIQDIMDLFCIEVIFQQNLNINNLSKNTKIHYKTIQYKNTKISNNNTKYYKKTLKSVLYWV